MDDSALYWGRRMDRRMKRNIRRKIKKRDEREVIAKLNMHKGNVRGYVGENDEPSFPLYSGLCAWQVSISTSGIVVKTEHLGNARRCRAVG